MRARNQSTLRSVPLDGRDGPEGGRSAESGWSDHHGSRPPSAEAFVAMVAHDLRLPLAHIKGFITTLRREDVEWDETTRRELFAEIELEADRLAHMLDGLLESGAPAAGSRPGTNLTSADPASVVRGALHRTRGLLGGRPLRVDVASALPCLRLDATQIERVLANLLQNAVKYSPPGTPIGISACVSGADEVELAVEDHGAGVAPEDRKHIFEPFCRTQTAARSNAPGYGLGLAICQSIVLAHGGRIRVTNRPGGGARFSVFLPMHAAQRAIAQDQGRDNTPAQHRGGRRRGTVGGSVMLGPPSPLVRAA